MSAPTTTSARWVCADGNEAAASVAHRLSDACALYPITPASPMGELAEVWSHEGRRNIWGQVPSIVQMQSEAGAAGTLHGLVQAGALATSFTSSQGLLLMLPNMYKIAGELTPAVLHVAARAIATHALSIFGDHSDVMAARSTGWAMLASNGVQEAHDLAAVAHVASLRSRIPFVHFFDGFRTSHELNRVRLLADEELRELVDEADVLAHRARAMTPARPVLRGTAQNPDVFFQAREAANPFYAAAPGVVAEVMERLGDLTGRRYGLVEYHGSPTADRVVVAMGSAVATLRETVDALTAAGEEVGVLAVRLYRPFPAGALAAALPAARLASAQQAAAQPIRLHCDLHLDPAKEKQMVEAYRTTFRPTISKQPGFVSVELLKLRSENQGKAPAGCTYRLIISFQTEEQRKAWVARPEHQKAWPTIENCLIAEKYSALLYDPIA